MMQPITFTQFTQLIESSIPAIYALDEWCGAVAEVLKQTGLRIGEVLDLSRWSYSHSSVYVVQLEKGEEQREIVTADFPILYLQALNGVYDPGFYDYRAVNYTIRKGLPYFVCNGDARRTVSHIYRYHFIQSLKEEGYTATQIQAIIKHKSKSSTELYMYDIINANV